MSDSVAPQVGKSVRVLGTLPIAAGAILFVSGAAAWIAISKGLAGEGIVVSGDAPRFAGRKVTGPLTAYQEAAIIQKHALSATGGKSFAELAEKDPLRQTAMTASFLRASLLTSVVAFGVAGLSMGLGLVSGTIGVGMGRLARR